MAKKNYWFHLIAILTVIVWGTTYISTKVLIGHGLRPAEIFFFRFLMAYFCIWLFSSHRIWSACWKDELLFLATGLTGGSLYFLFENTALSITLASNVALILCTAPILTAFLYFLVHRGERLKPNLIYGSIIAFSGVALVIFNGGFILRINPLGDMLTLLAALMWAFYSLIIKNLNAKYPTLFVTRKVFFYGLLTILPVFLFEPLRFDQSVLFKWPVLLNLLFLGLIASMLCYISWNEAAKHLGILRVTNYIYFSPMVTLVASAMLIHERITLVALVGSVFILAGVYMAEKGADVKGMVGTLFHKSVK